MKQKKIVLDVDGVLLDFMETFDRVAEIVLKRKVTINKNEYEQTDYHLGKRVGATDEQIHEILDYMIESKEYGNLKSLDGAKEAIEAIKKEGFEIFIVSAIPDKIATMRLENLKRVLDLEIKPENAYFVGMGKSKEAALFEINPDVFVDDRISYLVSAPDTCHLVWIDQKEVQDRKHEFVHTHVHSLKEWVDKFMPTISKELDNHYAGKVPLQYDLKLECFSDKYADESTRKMKM